MNNSGSDTIDIILISILRWHGGPGQDSTGRCSREIGEDVKTIQSPGRGVQAESEARKGRIIKVPNFGFKFLTGHSRISIIFKASRNKICWDRSGLPADSRHGRSVHIQLTLSAPGRRHSKWGGIRRRGALFAFFSGTGAGYPNFDRDTGLLGSAAEKRVIFRGLAPTLQIPLKTTETLPHCDYLRQSTCSVD